MKIKQSILALSTTALFAAAMSLPAHAELDSAYGSIEFTTAPSKGTGNLAYSSNDYTLEFSLTDAVFNYLERTGQESYVLAAYWCDKATTNFAGANAVVLTQADDDSWVIKLGRGYLSDTVLNEDTTFKFGSSVVLSETSIVPGENYTLSVDASAAYDVSVTATLSSENYESETLSSVNSRMYSTLSGYGTGTMTYYALDVAKRENVAVSSGDWTWQSEAIVGEKILTEDYEWVENRVDCSNKSVVNLSLEEGTAYVAVDNYKGSEAVETYGLTLAGKGNVQLSGNDLTVLEDGFISAASDTSITIHNLVNFQNGGQLKGAVQTSDTGTIKVSSGTLTADNFYGTGTLWIEEGARVEKNVVIGGNHTLEMKLKGTGTYSVKTKNSSDFVGILSFSGSEGEDFNGTVEIDGYTTAGYVSKHGGTLQLSNFSGIVKIAGCLDLENSDFDNASKVVCTGSGSWYYNEFGTKTISTNIDVLADVILNLRNGSAGWVQFDGEVCGDGRVNISLYSCAGLFNNRVDLGTFGIESGSITFNGENSKVEKFLGNLSSSYLSTQNIALGATLTITGEANTETSYDGAFVVSRTGIQTVNVDGVLNLQNDGISNTDSTGIVNVSGEMNFNAGLFVNDKGDDANAVTLNVKDGGRLNIGGSGMGISPSLALNLEGEATIGSLADKWEINRELTLNGKTTIDTTKRELNFSGAATATESGSTIQAYQKLSGDGSLVKTGAGTLELWASNSYTGGTTLEDGTLAVLYSSALGTGGLTVNGGLAILSTRNSASIEFGADAPLTVNADGAARIGGGTSVVIKNGTFENAGTMTVNSGGKLELNGGILDLDGALINKGTLNIIAQTDGVNSGVVIGDGATFTNSGTVVISAGTLAEGDSVTVFADANGVGISDSTGTVVGTGTLKVFGGYYENGVFTAGEKKEGSAGEDLGDNGHVKPGESVTVHDKHHHDKHGRYHAVYLASGSKIVVSQVDNLDCETINYGGKDYDIGASWDFNIEKDSDTEVFVQMYVGEGLDLDTIKVFHRGHGDNDDWEDYTETVGNLSYDKETGYLSFTTLTFSSYSVTGIYNSTFIPEPSVFGLLAGLSALALAVSRRRRKA